MHVFDQVSWFQFNLTHLVSKIYLLFPVLKFIKIIDITATNQLFNYLNIKYLKNKTTHNCFLGCEYLLDNYLTIFIIRMKPKSNSKGPYYNFYGMSNVVILILMISIYIVYVLYCIIYICIYSATLIFHNFIRYF